MFKTTKNVPIVRTTDGLTCDVLSSQSKKLLGVRLALLTMLVYYWNPLNLSATDK